jgi:4-phospho-D-threonate 3-dehydrogenase / 4-phospho-D-erythronate 3-dehydrogenase
MPRLVLAEDENALKPLLAITMGDVNGVGPEIIAKALTHDAPWECCEPVVLGSAHVLDTARTMVPACPETRVIKALSERDCSQRVVPVIEGSADVPTLQPGILDAAAGRCAVEWITLATELAVSGEVGGIVTAPINKEGIRAGGCKHLGHTDLIADLTNTPSYRMSLFTDTMKIVHVSGHCPLREAVELLTVARIAETIAVAHDALARMGMAEGRIAVAGLNPHAGEAGMLGDEDDGIIAPAVEQCRTAGIPCSGPYPPDTVFRRMREGEFDLVVAMYHDQGHIPMKLVAMEEGVNVTLGIPIVRTSVDHGTAYDIAGKGVADESSMLAAIKMAARLAGGERP